MSNYPDWVLKHKEKGTYINCAKGKYYLYAAHSERVPGTKKVKRICDGYLGRITEKDGLIPPKDKVSGEVYVYEYGLSHTILTLCRNIHTGFKQNFKNNADFVMVSAILTFIYSDYNEMLFNQSYLSEQFSDLSLNKEPTLKQSTAIARGVLMIQDTLTKILGSDLNEIILSFKHVYKVKINNGFYLSNEPDIVQNFKEKYSIEWEK